MRGRVIRRNLLAKHANPWIPVLGWDVLDIRTVPNHSRIKIGLYNRYYRIGRVVTFIQVTFTGYVTTAYINFGPRKSVLHFIKLPFLFAIFHWINVFCFLLFRCCLEEPTQLDTPPTQITWYSSKPNFKQNVYFENGRNVPRTYLTVSYSHNVQ